MFNICLMFKIPLNIAYFQNMFNDKMNKKQHNREDK